MTALTAAQLADMRGDLGVPTNVQVVTITGSPTGGTFPLTYNGATATLAYNVAASAAQAALEALATIGVGNVIVTGSAGGPYRVTFTGELASVSVAMLTSTGIGLTGGTSPSVAISIDLVFSDVELNRFWTRAAEDYDVALVYAYRNLLADAVKLHKITAGNTSEDLQQVREGVEKLLSRWEKAAGMEGGGLSTGSLLLGLDELEPTA